MKTFLSSRDTGSRRLVKLVTLAALSCTLHGWGATVWTGPRLSFAKADNADPADAANQDRITGNVWITRAGSEGIYNAKSEAVFTHFSSPADTEWANGTTANLENLTFADWNTWSKNGNGGPPNTVGVDAVLHLISEDIYLDIKFTSWSTASGGGFAYERSTAEAVSNTPPAISLSSPADGASFTNPNPVLLTADASDTDGSVSAVEFFDGATSLGTFATPPYSLSTNLSSGSHTLTAKATDDQGASTTSAPVTVSVNNTVISNPIAERVPKGELVIELKTVADGMASPLGMAVPDDGSGRMFVYDQSGLVWLVTTNGRSSEPVLDVRARLSPAAKYDYDERGLLGLAAHPNFAEHPLLYTYTSETNGAPADFPASMSNGAQPNHQSVITEWRMDSANSNRVNAASRREVLRVDKPQSNHNGGTMRFGPDGLLYFTIGDGGNANDSGNGHVAGGNAQNLMQILGKVLRIDVDERTSANGQYGIPTDNPFNGTNGLREIFAYGLRNPFCFSFDKSTGDLYLADVGQNKVEEVDLISKGGNYGWNIREGSFWFDAGQIVSGPTRPVPPGLIDPIAVYDHDDGLAVIGGFVYRGSAIPGLQGRYVFGDWGSFSTPSGRLFYLDENNQVKEFRIGLDDRSLGHWIKGFGEGADGELYVFCTRVVGPAGNTGKMLQITAAPAPMSLHLPTPTGTNLAEAWDGGTGPFALQKKQALSDLAWMNVNFSTGGNATTTADGVSGFFRVSDTARQPGIPFSASLSGAAEHPATGSSGTGFGLFGLDGNTFSFSIHYSGLSGPATMAHIHGAASAAESAGIQIDLGPFHLGPFGTSGSFSGTMILSDAQKAMVLAGQTYVNLHTASNPNGEIRGQIAPVLMQLVLKDSNEHPPLDTGGNGFGELALVGDQLTFNITYRGLSGTALAAHIHGPATMTGDAGVLINLAPYNGGAFGAEGSLNGTVTLTPSQLASVIDGLTYVNFHTSAHSLGEIRGQILPHSTAVPLSAPLSGLSVKPTAITNAATGSAILSLEGNTLAFSISYKGLSGTATMAHIHGPATSSQTAGIQIDLSPFKGSGFGSAGRFAGNVVLSDEQREMILSGQTYINIHTTANPSGEIRGQIAPVLMDAYLSGAEQRPAVLNDGTALGIFALVLDELSFDISYSDLGSIATQLDLHGPANVNQTAASMLDLSAFNGGTWGTFGNVSGSVALTASQLANIVDRRSYLNLHTVNAADGEIRGQLTR